MKFLNQVALPTTGGLNFDAKVRRQSNDKYDLFYGHISEWTQWQWHYALRQNDPRWRP